MTASDLAEIPTVEERLADPVLWRQLRAVAAYQSRRRPWLREEFESLVGFTVANSLKGWRPDGGAAFRSFTVAAMKHNCMNVVRADRPRGYRRNGGWPAVGSLDELAEDLAVDVGELVPSRAEPTEAELERSELASMALRLAGEDAMYLEAVACSGETLRALGARWGMSHESVRQRAAQGARRARAGLHGLG